MTEGKSKAPGVKPGRCFHFREPQEMPYTGRKFDRAREYMPRKQKRPSRGRQGARRGQGEADFIFCV